MDKFKAKNMIQWFQLNEKCASRVENIVYSKYEFHGRRKNALIIKDR